MRSTSNTHVSTQNGILPCSGWQIKLKKPVFFQPQDGNRPIMVLVDALWTKDDFQKR
jgi:hypothetical protein